MSLDLIYKNKFYVDPSLSFPYQSEKVTGTYTAVKIRESSGIDRDIDFTLKITTHRLHFTAESGYKTHLEVPMKAFIKLTLAHKGVINRKTYVVINTNVGSEFELYHPSIEEIYSQINSNFNSKLWQVEDKPSSQFDAGLGFINKQFKAEVNQTRAEVTSSTGDVQSLITKSEKLRELISYLKKNVTNESQKSELDEILSSIDAVSVVTKDEAGKNFYDELAKSVYTVTRELLNRYHGVASLVDVFYITNEKRKISLISPTDLLKACGRFQQLGLPVKLVELGKGLRVIQDINFNSDEDYKRNIAPYIDEEDGITAETLSRKTKIPLLLAISKLQMALDQGKIIIDDTIEGKRYFHNFILF